MQSLGVQPAAPKMAARGQAGAADKPSFRSSMERAEQEAAQAAKEPAAEAAAAKEAVEQPEEPQLQEGLKEAAEAAAMSAVEEAAGETGEEEAMEGLLSLLGASGEKTQEETPEEDALAQSELMIGELAAALMQQANGQDAQPPAVEAGQALPQEAVQEGQARGNSEILAAVQAVPQDAEQQAASRTEAQAANTNFENTLAEAAAQPVATKAREQAAPQEQNMQETPDRQVGQPFSLAQQPVTIADLTAANGEPLPAPEMARALQESIFDQIQSAVSTGKQELFIQLKPENLGGLAIQLTMTEEGIKAQVRTGSENIQNLVNTQIAQLEDALKARDIPIVQMEVILDQSANNSFLGQQRQAWQEQGGGNRAAMTMPIEETASLYEAALAAAPDDLADGVTEGVEYTA